MSFVAISMSDKRFDKISDMVRKSYVNACVLYIDEVVNAPLQEAYERRRESIKSMRGAVEERQLFHGTSDEFIDPIAINGFDPTKNKTAMYGYGTYFAVNASYSYNYMRSATNNEVTYMFLADVLIGLQTQGKRQQPGTAAVYDWDNNVDVLSKPTIYTSPYADGAYPRYIIAFHKNAK